MAKKLGSPKSHGKGGGGRKKAATPAKKAATPAKKTAAVEKFRDIDECSMASLIRARIPANGKGIAPEVVKEQVLKRVGMAFDANMKLMKSNAAIDDSADGKLRRGTSFDKPRKIVCDACGDSSDFAGTAGYTETQVFNLVHDSQFYDSDLPDMDYVDAIRDLGGSAGACIKRNAVGLYLPG